MTNSIKKPIFIIGSGRSGTSILYNILCCHPDISFFNALTNRYPKMSFLASANLVYSFPLIGNFLQKLLTKSTENTLPISPSEGKNIYHYVGFDDKKKLTEKDKNTIDINLFKTTIKNHVFYSRKKRFLSKRTANTQRLRLINAIFPDAYYIHIVRDGRAVVGSLLKTPWWPELPLWWTQKNPRELQSQGHNGVEIAGLHWKSNVEEILKNRKLFKKRYLQIRYENFTKSPRGVIKSILAFCKLPKDDKFMELIPKYLPNMNSKWKVELSDREKKLLGSIINPLLKKLNYA